MTKHETQTRGSGELKAKQRRRRYWTGMIVPVLVTNAVLLGTKMALGGQLWDKAGRLNPTFAVIAAAMILLGTLIGGIWQHRLFDENEERAALWANTVALYFLIGVGFAADMLSWAQLVSSVSHVAIIIAAFVPALATFFWLRFR